MKTDHVTFIAASAEFRCERCGAFQYVVDEVDIATCITQLRGFALTHSVCKPRPEPTRQLPLPHTQDHTKTAKDRAPGRSREEPAGGSAPTSEEPNGGAEEARPPMQDGKPWCGECGCYHNPGENTLCPTNPCPCGDQGRPGHPLGHCDSAQLGPHGEGIDGSTDEPAPEIDPPGPDVFAQLYPMARDHGTLRDDLHAVLTPEQYALLPNGTVEAWHPATGIFDAIAHWARIEKAHIEIPKREPIAGFYLQGRMPMPVKLAELLGKPAKPKRARKPRKPRAAEPLNACGPNDTDPTSI